MSKKALYTLEYPVRCSPGILYEFLSTPAGLQEWFGVDGKFPAVHLASGEMRGV